MKALRLLFATKSTDTPETPDTPILKRASSLNRNEIETRCPHIASNNLASLLALFDVSEGEITNGQKIQGKKIKVPFLTMERADGVRILCLIGQKSAVYAVFKNPEGTDRFHLDALQVLEGPQVTNIPCGEGLVDGDRLNEFLLSLRQTVRLLKTDSDIDKITAEQHLNKDIAAAMPKLFWGNVLDEICSQPAPRSPW